MAWIALNLIGYVASYFSIRAVLKTKLPWTVEERTFALVMSAFWPIMITAAGIVFVSRWGGWSKPAKW